MCEEKDLSSMLLLLLLSRFSHVRLCAIPQMEAHQAPPSLGFSRQEHWSGLPSGPNIYLFEVLNIDILPWSPNKCILIIKLWVSGHFIDVGDNKRIYWNEMKCICQSYHLQENAIYIYIYRYIDVRHKVILLIIMVPAFLLFPLWAHTWIYSYYRIFSHVPCIWYWLSFPKPCCITYG